ncbi:LysR family transcriptional regulator [Undibacterium sp. Di27W]|uniref:LysR family transcriptional regulator n=1 Tax=Undibacterium sp. Di27W TaxID=3413036 RepID=UPI003BF32395
MPSIDLVISFASAARHSSFASAARELGLSPSAVAKNVARLETQLGMRLFHRTTRQVRLSQDGEDIYLRCKRILEDMESLHTAAIEAREGLRGTLRIDMPIFYGRQVVLPILMQLKILHPALKIDARFSDHMVDIVKEGLDAAVRIGVLTDSGLIARNFDEQFVRIYASPDYISRHGKPRSPEELAEHTCLLFRSPTSGRDRPWQFLVEKHELVLLPESDVRLGDGEALIQAAVAGVGIVQLPSYMVENEVTQGRLVEILKRFRAAPQPIALVYSSHRHVPPRVRALADALLLHADKVSVKENSQRHT